MIYINCKIFSILTSGALIFSYLFSINKDKSFIAFLNALFIIGLIYLIYGGFSILNEVGFFNIIKYSFKKIKIPFWGNKTINNDNKENIKFEDYVLQRVEASVFTKPTLISGILICLFTIFIGFYLYK